MKKSKISHAVLDKKNRKNKALSIIKVLSKYKNIRKCKILDIGTGSGIIAFELGRLSKKTYSVDVIDERITNKNFDFKKVKDERLPFNNNYFDVVVSNHVMAHTKNDNIHMKEINRVMKKDGIAYISMLNRMWPLEPNFNLFFLSWLPKKIADYYVKLAGKGDYYNVNPMTYIKFKKKITKYFDFEDVTINAIRNRTWMPKIAYDIIKTFSPGWIFILKKR